MSDKNRWFESVPVGDDGKTVAGWFHRGFVRGLEDDANPSYWATARDADAGIFPIMLLSLSYVAAAAGLVLGVPDAHPVAVVDFITHWFGRFEDRSGSRYREHAAALYPLFRHGLAHQRHPGLLDVGDGRNLGWALGRERNRERHLVLGHGGMVETATGRRVSYLLSVHADLVFDDALHVFRSIEAVLVGDAALARRVSQGAWEAKTRTLKGRSQKVLQPRIQAALDALDAAVPPVP